MGKNEPTDQKRWKWIHRMLVILGAVFFIPLVYLGAAPFVVKALMPALDSASEEGLFMKSFEIYFRPIEKVCNWWPWYDDWGTEIVE